MKKQYRPRLYFWRNTVLINLALRIIGIPYTAIKQVHYGYYRPKNKVFLLVANHNDSLDPGYEMLCLGRYIRFVSGDHVVRNGFMGRFLNFFGTPIIKYRNHAGEELILDIKNTLDAGISVGLHAEGGTSFNGESRYISPNTAKLIKENGHALITYRSYGGYLRSPRWRKYRRKGPLYGGVVGEYDKEEISRMSEEEIYELISNDLYVNVYDEQRKNRQLYKGKALAEHCEIILYRCPACEHIGRLHSIGNLLSCDCGYTVEMKEDGFFHGYDGKLIYDNICDWEHWQRETIKNYLDEWKEKRNEPIYEDKEQILKEVKDNKEKVISEQAVILLYYDHIEIHWESGNWQAALLDIKKMEYVKKDSLLIVTEQDYFDVGSKIPRSPTKYMDAWRYLTGRKNL